MIKHHIKLDGPGVSGTRVNACVLRNLLDVVIDGSQRAVRLRTQGRSLARGQLPRWIQASSEFTVQVLEGSTVLEVEALSLQEAGPKEFEQRELFPEINPELSSFDYFAESLTAAMAGDDRSNLYDRSMLELLQNFSTVFDHGVESIDIQIGKAKKGPSIQVQRSALQSFSLLEAKIPEPRQVRLAGKLDQIRHSDHTLLLKLLRGNETVKGVADPSLGDSLKRHWGQIVLIKGNAHFNVGGGLLRIEVEQLNLATKQDAELWADVPEPLNKPVLQTTFRQPQGPRSGLNAIIGKWPSDETDDEITAELETLS